jgi:transposase-like protein
LTGVNRLIQHGNMGRPKDPKYSQASDMYSKGMSIGDLAEFYQVTRQAMWKILSRRSSLRSQKRFGSENHFFRGGSIADKRSHHLVESAISKGVIVPKPCEICGKKGRAHHDDYNRPLDVRWLCQKHHFHWHQNNTAKPIEDKDHLMRSLTISSP